MNTKQASILLEQAIDVAQHPGNGVTLEQLERVAGLLVTFRDGWFAPRRLAAERPQPKAPELPSSRKRCKDCGCLMPVDDPCDRCYLCAVG